MNNDKVIFAGVAIVCALILGGSLYVSRPVSNVSVAPQGTPVVVSGDAKQGEFGSGVMGLLQSLSDQIAKLSEKIGQSSQAPATDPEEFGALRDTQTVWTDGRFTGGLIVNGVLSASSTTFSGEVNTTSVQRIVTKAVSSSGSSQLLATFPAPTTGRFVKDLNCAFATSTNTGGLIRVTASLGATQATGTTMGTDLFMDNTVETATVLNPNQWWVPTTTLPGFASSTAGTVPGDVISFNVPRVGGPVFQSTLKNIYVMVASPTSTLSGACYVEYASPASVGN